MPNTKTTLFNEFPAISKQEWLDKMEQDLKGKALEELRWSISEDLSFDPAYTIEDNLGSGTIIEETANHWEIGEYISFGDTKQGNKEALKALAAGTEALLFLVEEPFSDLEYEQLLQGIELEYISTHFSFRGGFDIQSAFLKTLAKVLPQEKRNKLKGSLDVDILRDEKEVDFSSLAAFLKKSTASFPAMKCLNIDGSSFYNGKEKVIEELAQLLFKLEEYTRGLQAEGMDINEWGEQCFFSIAVDTSFFLNIAKIRALKLLVVEWQKAYGLQIQLPTIEVHFAASAYGEDQYTNMIKATSIGMSAILAGVSRLFILPAHVGTKEEASDFQRRIARNVQHLFKMESGLDQVGEPAAGSYYVEQMTEMLAEKSWKKFQELTK